MLQIFNLTIKRMFKIRYIVAYFTILNIAIIAASIFMKYSERFTYFSSLSSFDSFEENYMLLSFLWFCGIPVILSLVAHGAGLFSAEENEGTLCLLVIKPISRFKITTGKISGLIAGQFIYMVISTLFGTILMTLIMGSDPDVITRLLPLIPSILLYGLFIIVFFTSIVSFLAVLFKSKIPSLVIVFILVGIYYFCPLFIRNDFYSKNNKFPDIGYFDVNYHIGLIHRLITGAGDRVQGTAFFRTLLSFFAGTFENLKPDVDISFDVNQMVLKGSNLSAVLVLLVYLLFASMLYYFTFKIMKKKDIH